MSESEIATRYNTITTLINLLRAEHHALGKTLQELQKKEDEENEQEQ